MRVRVFMYACVKEPNWATYMRTWLDVSKFLENKVIK